MNDYDLTSAEQRYSQGDTPNRLRLTRIVSALREWADQNSDGWAYWPKPVRAASKAIELIDSTTTPENQRRSREDITEVEMSRALSPIKAFLTRQHVSEADRQAILSPPAGVSVGRGAW
jgi:hypothetical protein